MSTPAVRSRHGTVFPVRTSPKKLLLSICSGITKTPGRHVITYWVTGENGNSAHAERVVIVVTPTASKEVVKVSTPVATSNTPIVPQDRKYGLEIGTICSLDAGVNSVNAPGGFKFTPNLERRTGVVMENSFFHNPVLVALRSKELYFHRNRVKTCLSIIRLSGVTVSEVYMYSPIMNLPWIYWICCPCSKKIRMLSSGCILAGVWDLHSQGKTIWHSVVIRLNSPARDCCSLGKLASILKLGLLI